VAVCQACGAKTVRWVGRCPECGEWGTVVEEPTNGGSGVIPTVKVEMESLASQAESPTERIPTGIGEVDRVLGGGIADGSVVLLAGEPGVGKSTLTLQIALALGLTSRVLLVCAEEAPQQVRARGERLGPILDGVGTVADPRIDAVLGAIGASEAPIVVVDSIQTVFDPEIPSAPGSVSQVRECGAKLVRAARDRGLTVVLVGHITKEGTVAGPKVLEHLVDVVLMIEGERSTGVRVLRALKNRFGTTDEVGFFEMTSSGLIAISDASAFLLADRCKGLPGSVLSASLDGRRPFVSEIQALVAGESSIPRRNAVGVDATRLPLLCAVVEQHARIKLDKSEVYVSSVGGIRTSEPASDLAVVLAILSSVKKVALPDDAVAFGEIGLSGEVRQVGGPERRLREALHVGCTRAFVPHNLTGSFDGMKLHRIRHVGDALDVFDKRW
jgi:DNA repair protein RadA/Sms